MDRLILLRHGKAEARAASGEDFDRPLTPRGWRDARLIANAVAEAGFAPDRAVVSAAVRTRETWEAVAPTFPGAILETRPELYDADARVLLAAGQTPLGRTVAIVAHNPGLQILAIALALRALAPAVEARLRDGFATGAAAAFGFAEDRVEALGLYYPADYGGGPD
jgi:phosphohistidine phosphatase